MSLSKLSGRRSPMCRVAGPYHDSLGVAMHFQRADVRGRFTFGMAPQVTSKVRGCWVVALSKWSTNSTSKCNGVASCHLENKVAGHCRSHRCSTVALSTDNARLLSKCGSTGPFHLQNGVAGHFQSAEVLAHVTFKPPWQTNVKVRRCWVA